MEMIITKHMVRPSSPTPHELKTHKLSSIDQLVPPIYIPIVFFYENDRSKPHDEIVQHLKQSLSEILTVFYPLAGTIIANSFVDCDDSGIEMIEARVRARLSHFIENPRIGELKLLPTDNIFSHDENLILSVKASFFDCGGFAVGVCMSHKVVDAASLVSFVNAWAAACRGEEASRIIRPAFDLAVHFPPSSALSALQATSTEKEITFKRFVFDLKKLEKLRKEASSSSSSDGVKDPTKVEAVSGFLCRNFVEAYKAKSSEAVNKTTPFIASHAVNLRPRTSPPLPYYNTFGNCVGIENAVISSPEEDETPNLGTIVSKLRAAIKRVDNDYINNVIKNEKYPQTLAQAYDLLNNSRYCFVSSWRFPVYEADFGWGKPVWACCGTMDMVVLMDNPTMDGIEAWVNFNDLDLIQTFQANYDKLIA